MKGSAIIGSPLTASPLPGPFHSLFDQTCRRCAEREALTAEDGRLTYAQLQQHVDSAARGMLGLGVQRGDHIGILMGYSVQWAVLFYAAASIGAVTVPLNTRFRTEELAFALRQADVKVLFATARFLESIDFAGMLRRIEPALDRALPGSNLPELQQVVMVGETIPAAAMSWTTFANRAGVVPAQHLARARAAVLPEDTLLIQFTSGTTATPKGVMLSHAAMLGNAASVARRLGLKGTDRYFSARPFSHVAGTTLSLLVSLVGGICLVTTATFNAAQALRVMESEGCTLTSGNDTMFLMMLADPMLPKRNLVLRGGWAAAGEEVMYRVMEQMGAHQLCNAYGLSEAGPNVILSDHTDPPELRAEGWARPHWGIQVIVYDAEEDRPCEPGEPGEIYVRGWSIMKGYYNRPEETDEVLDPDGWLRTGDIGHTDGEGRLQFLGRAKDMFRVGGENVAPAEVESVLLQHPAVAMAQVVGVPEERLGEVPAAFVVLHAGKAATAEALIAFCKERCAGFKVPRHLDVVKDFESFGMTASSKVQRNRLREHAIQHFGLAAKKQGG